MDIMSESNLEVFGNPGEDDIILLEQKALGTPNSFIKNLNDFINKDHYNGDNLNNEVYYELVGNITTIVIPPDLFYSVTLKKKE